MRPVNIIAVAWGFFGGIQMRVFHLTIGSVLLCVSFAAVGGSALIAQVPSLPPMPVPDSGPVPQTPTIPNPTPATEAPQTPNGLEVLSRGPVHEAFATLITEPTPTIPVDKQPPKAISELPPAEKPEGQVEWIPGYWGWDDERKDFLSAPGVCRHRASTG
jgi:hypothetical protein